VLVEDPQVYLADFGTDATYKSVATVRVIFDRSFLEQLGIVGSASPAALCATEDLDADVSDQDITILGVAYKIRAGEPVDDGLFTVLRLEKAA
jgi:hypothetical protein